MRRIAAILLASMLGCASSLAIATPALSATHVQPGAQEHAERFVADAVKMGASEELAKRALWNPSIARGIVTRVEAVTLDQVPADAKSREADAQLEEAAAACGPYAKSRNFRWYYYNGFGQLLYYININAVRWHYNGGGGTVSCPTISTYGDNSGLGATTGWNEGVKQDDVGYYYSWLGGTSYSRKLSMTFTFKPPPCYCVVAQKITRTGTATLHPNGSSNYTPATTAP